jgi:diguanylate cyclase (GGDEF)-like protein
VSWLLAVLAGACLHEALQHALRVAGRWDLLRAMVSALCVSAAVYLVLLTLSYATVDEGPAVAQLRVAVIALMGGMVLLALALRRFAGRSFTRGHQALALLWLGFVLAELLVPGGVLFTSTLVTSPLRLPWGETLYLHLGDTNPGLAVALTLLLLALAAGLWDVHRLDVARWGQPGRLARAALWGMLVLLVAVMIARSLGFPGTALITAPVFAAAVLTLAWAMRTRRVAIAIDQQQRDARRLARSHALMGLSRRDLATVTDEASAVADLADAARRLLGVDRISWWRIEGADRMRSCVVMDDRGGSFEQPMVLDASAFPRYFAHLRDDSVLAAADSPNDERFAELREGYFLPMGVRSTLDIAIRTGGKLVGLCCVESVAQPREWDDDDIAFLSGLSAIAGERWASLWQARSANVLSSLAGVASGDVDFLRLTVREVARLFEADIAFIGEVEPDGDNVRSLAVWWDGRPAEPFRYALLGTPCAGAVSGGSCNFPAGVADRFPDDAMLRDLGIEGYVAAPFSGGTTRGLVVALRRRPMPDDPALASAMQVIAARVGAEIERQQAEERIHRLAFEDHLTGLPTRSALGDAMAKELAKASPEAPAALLIIDLDHFKVVNDALSHDVGDRILCQLALELAAACLPGEIVARLGGDEFALLIPATPGLDEPKVLARAGAMMAVVESPRQVGERVLSVGGSIGAATFDGSVGGVTDVIRRAELALYRAKTKGRARTELYREQMEVAASRRLAIQEGLRHALPRGELSLHLQPKVDIHGVPVGAEALLRWTHPELGPVSPADFIPVAEETGLIAAIGTWALREACRICRDMPPEMFDARPFTVSVNVSAWQLARPHFVEEVLAVVDGERIPARWITLEITESLVLHDLEDVIRKLRALRAAGFLIALDDFGTGYSSLSYLRQLPLDELKIDRSFTRELEAGHEHPLVQSMVAIGGHMGLQVVAEGVETAEQADQLTALGCDMFQGYRYARPMPVAEFLPWLKANLPRALRTVR